MASTVVCLRVFEHGVRDSGKKIELLILSHDDFTNFLFNACSRSPMRAIHFFIGVTLLFGCIFVMHTNDTRFDTHYCTYFDENCYITTNLAMLRPIE